VREAFRVLYREIKTVKQAGRRVHLSIAGGRKTLSIYGMAAAQLLFDPDDCAWHLVSTPELIASQALHAGPGQAQLLSVPVLRWSQISPVLTELAMSDDPFEAVALQEQLHRADVLRLPRSFVRTVLSPAEEKVVRLAVCEGLTDRQIALRLGRSPKTVGHQLSAAYAKAVAHFGIDGANRHTLTTLLATYYALEGGT
jgi:CRISPR-associated protein Csx14